MTRINAALRDSRPTGPSAHELVRRRRPVTPDGSFRPLPAPVGDPPYRRALAAVIGTERVRSIADAGAIRFHLAGDTGGDVDPRPQRRVAAAMASELDAENPPSFFFHLGDIAYPHGEAAVYRSQFFGAYREYAAPIFAIPGNHDAESSAGLDPFVRTFCSPAPPLFDASSSASARRPLACQPHVHWTLMHDWVRIIGVYTNVPEGGQLSDEQLSWLVGELRAAPRDTVTIVAMHQPVYSADVTHGSNLALVEVLDDCAAEAGRGPDAVICGHAHCYQRFDRRREDRSIPHLVAGAGGYPELHPLGHGIAALPAAFDGLPGVTLEAYSDSAHGFLTVTARPGGADAIYTAVTATGTTVRDRVAISTPNRPR